MKILSRLPIVTFLLAWPAALLAQGFQLPPNPEPTETPQVQGPVDTESGNLPVAPRVIESPSPNPAATPTPNASVQPVPTPAQTEISAGPDVAAQAPRQSPAPRAQPSSLPASQERLPLDPGERAPLVPETAPQVTPSAAPGTPTPRPDTRSLPVEAEEENDWMWPLIGGGIIALLGLGYLVASRRKQVEPSEIERPVVPAAAARPKAGELRLDADVIKLTRSVMNATLNYRVSLLNRSTAALENVSIGADIVSAHGGAPVDQQVASAANPLENRHIFARISPGQSVQYEGQLTLPLSQVRAIRQGNAPLFVPLLRLRVDGAGAEPLVRTFVVGLAIPGGGRVMPFRLDEGPRSYEPIAARALD